jgi:PmbA protein
VNGKDVATGEYDVILSPLAFAQILGQVIIPALSGRNVHAGRSYLAPFLGRQIFDREFSLYDDPHIPRGLGSSFWDAEGVPTRRLDLISDGVLGCFAYDLKTAYRYGKESTGSAVRGGFGGSPSIGMHNVVVDGPRSDIRDERAVYVENLIGAHTANPMSGDFSVELTNPMWMEAGEYEDPVRKAMLAGNAFALLKEIGGLGKDTRALGSMRLPSIRLNSQHIIGK